MAGSALGACSFTGWLIHGGRVGCALFVLEGCIVGSRRELGVLRRRHPGDVRSCIPLIPKPMSDCVIMEHAFPFLSEVEFTEVDADKLTCSHAVAQLSFYGKIGLHTIIKKVHGQYLRCAL
eukprot:1145144-Pelagomonas_calceolata.AAC.1